MEDQFHVSSAGTDAPRARGLSAIELILGAIIVLGHNVYGVLPNEVLILAAAGLISSRLRDGSISALGFRRPASWRNVIALALAAAALRLALGSFVIEPLAERYFPEIKAPEGIDAITGNLGVALLFLGLVWTFAAFGEEIAYRGYLLLRAADLGNRSNLAYWTGVVLVSVLFGFGHFYKGPAGIIDSGVAGLILGAAFILSGRNLWTSILAHGFIDTFGVVALYFGYDI